MMKHPRAHIELIKAEIALIGANPIFGIRLERFKANLFVETGFFL